VSRHADPISTRRLVVGVASWALLLLAWWLVLERDPRSWAAELAVPVVAVVVVTVVTLWWVRHNLGIYQRKGPRRGLPDVSAPWTQDSLGRPLVLADGVAQAPVVRLRLDGDLKRYEVAP